MADEEESVPQTANEGETAPQVDNEADSTQAVDIPSEAGQEPPAEQITMEAVSVVDPSTPMADMEELVQNLDFDPYNEDQTELRFLHSKPSCFIVIGKPGVGKTTLARRLALEWKCELINSTNLINQNQWYRSDWPSLVLLSQENQPLPSDLWMSMVWYVCR